MINRYFQIARTYYRRPRFWIFGGLYLVSIFWWRDRPNMALANALGSTALAMAVGCFIALHLRRQFSSAAAGVWPDFVGPHLVVGGAASLLVCVGVPSAKALLSGMPVMGLIAVHAIAAIFTAFVVCWRRAIFMLVSLPLLTMISVTRFVLRDRIVEWLNLLVHGEEPWGAVVLIAVAALMHVVAAVVLVRLGDRATPLTDDLLAEMPGTEGVAGHFGEFLLNFRDTATRHRLADAGHFGWRTNRWRVPVGLSLWHFLFTVAAVVIGGGFFWYMTADRGGIGVAVLLAAPLMMMTPFSMWHQRRCAIEMEFMRPVERKQFFRQMGAALAVDVALWTSLIVAMTTATFLFVAKGPFEGPMHRIILIIVLSLVVVSLAVWLYGVGVLLFRVRYWIPLLIGLLFAWCFCVVPLSAAIANPRLWADIPVNRVVTFLLGDGLIVFPILTASFGLWMARIAYRTWIESDVN